MNSMMEALKRKMGGDKDPVLEIDIMSDQPVAQDANESEVVDDVNAGPAPMLEHEMEVMAPEAEGAGGSDVELMQILEALGDRQSMGGEGGLHARAAGKAKEKMAMMKK